MSLAISHKSGVSDNADLQAVANGLLAQRSSYTDNGITGPGGETQLSLPLLSGIVQLASNNSFSISEVAGGVHSGQGHYNGNAIDVNIVNNVHVSQMSEADVNTFHDAAIAAGATLVLDPDHGTGHSTHFHIQW